MFHFIHGYLPQTSYWDGLVKRSFIDDTSGLKITQHSFTPAYAGFNEACSINSSVWQIVKEADRPFYVDRLQGGCYYYRYPFSKELIKSYSEILGEHFLGFQMHEWASNFTCDLNRIAEVVDITDKFPSAEIIVKALNKKYNYPHVYLESQTAKEFSAMKCPKTVDEMLSQLNLLFSKRMELVEGHIIPTDSYYIGARMEAMNGVKNLMPEIGAQICYTRIQIAITRGVAKAKNINWGTYYEPWGGEPFGSCYYKTDMENEWFFSKESDFPFKTNGENGGSSRALQKRILFYSYLSGASYISEEWGMCNTFYDWKDYEITPYGAVKKDFLNFVKSNSQVGETYTPFAIVLPKELEFFDLSSLVGKADSYLSLPVSNEKKRITDKIASVLHLIYGNGKEKCGNEGHAMTNSSYGDLFNIIYEDDADIFSNYEYVIDLTESGTFANQNAKFSNRILQSEDVDSLKYHLDEIISKILPFKIEAGLHYVVNRLNDGWIIGLFNNEGVSQSVAKGEVLMEEANKIVKISCTTPRRSELLYGDGKLSAEDNTLTLEVKAGQLAIIKLI